MRYRRFGRTGLEISEITFGAGWVGGLMIHQPDTVKSQALERMQSAGINWLDTAASYGDGQSEEALGRLLPGMDYDPYLSTKFNVDPASQDIAGDIEASLTRSLGRLNRSRVTLLQLHNRIQLDGTAPLPRHLTVNQVLGPGGVAEILHRLRDQGLFDHVGFTALGTPEACKHILASDAFDTAQIYYNMLNPSAGRTMPAGWTGQDLQQMLQTAADHDVGVMNIRVFAGGALVASEPHGREVPITDDADTDLEYRRGTAVAEIYKDQAAAMSQLALRHSFAEPRISTIVIGIATLEYLDLALAAATQEPLAPDLMARLEALYANNFGMG